MDDNSYREISVQLNGHFFAMYMLHFVKKRKRSHFHYFLIGSEDLGNTTIKKCLLKALVRDFDSKPGGNTNELKLLKPAPETKLENRVTTSKAATYK